MDNLPHVIANALNIDFSIIEKVFEKLTEEEINVIRLNFTERNVEYDMLFKYYSDIIPRIRELANDEIKNTGLADYTYRKKDSEFISLDEYAQIFDKIRKGYYVTLAETLTPKELMIVLMKIVSTNKKHLSDEEISGVLDISPIQLNKTMIKVFKSCKPKVRRW